MSLTLQLRPRTFSPSTKATRLAEALKGAVGGVPGAKRLADVAPNGYDAEGYPLPYSIKGATNG